MFRELPNVINDLTAIEQITRAALEQFAYHHSTIYLELRTTPKRLLKDFQEHRDMTDPIVKCTKRDYMETIIRTVRQFEEFDQKRYEDECRGIITDQNQDGENSSQNCLPRLPMTCRIIVSVDRSQSLSEATENIDLAIALYQESEEPYVVGVDLGGNPTQQDFGMFESLFQKARDAGLKVTIHCAEMECPSVPDMHNHTDSTGISTGMSGIIHSKEYKEIQRILQFRPDRIGHGVLLPKDLLLQLEVLQIPIETCPTSNVLTLEMFHHDHDHNHHHHPGTLDNSSRNSSTKRIQAIIHGLQNHHNNIQHWLNKKYPIIICTDDPGIFDTNISNELYIVYRAFHQTASFGILDLIHLVENSMNYAFCSNAIRTIIQQQLQQRICLIWS
jgi:adenosine deaminase